MRISRLGKSRLFFSGGELADAAGSSGSRRPPTHLWDQVARPTGGQWRDRPYLSGRRGRSERPAPPRCSPCFPCACGVSGTWRAAGACRGRRSAAGRCDSAATPSYRVPLLPLKTHKRKRQTNITQQFSGFSFLDLLLKKQSQEHKVRNRIGIKQILSMLLYLQRCWSRGTSSQKLDGFLQTKVFLEDSTASLENNENRRVS